MDEPRFAFRAVGNGSSVTPVLISTGEAGENRLAREFAEKTPQRQGNEAVAILQSGGIRAMRRFNRFSSRGIEYADVIYISSNGVFLKLDESRGKE